MARSTFRRNRVPAADVGRPSRLRLWLRRRRGMARPAAGLSEEHRMVRDLVVKFVERDLMPLEPAVLKREAEGGRYGTNLVIRGLDAEEVAQARAALVARLAL